MLSRSSLFGFLFHGLPRELEEAARIDGAGVVRTFFDIILPNAKTGFSVSLFSPSSQWGASLAAAGNQRRVVRPPASGYSHLHGLPPLRWGDLFAFG